MKAGERTLLTSAALNTTNLVKRSAMSDVNSTVQYRPVPSCPGYRVGSDGTVWHCIRISFPNGRWQKATYTLGDKWKLVRPWPCRSGHMLVRAINGTKKGDWRQVHRLVLEAFVGPCPEGMEACHFPDRDPSNNRIENLRWDTRKNNHADKKKHGTSSEGEKHYHCRLTEAQVREIREARAMGQSLAGLSRKYKVSYGCISGVVHVRTWKHLV